MKNSIDEWVEVLLTIKRLAAQLGQGDISEDEYAESVSYDFPFVLRQILGMDSD